MKYFNNVLEMIGNTPMVKINNMNPNPKVLMLAKLEKYNPGGSVKDRIAISMIEGAEKERKLNDNRKIIMEATSGNTGIGLAMVAAAKGYDVQLVMPESMSIERRKILKAFGSNIIYTEAKKKMDGAVELAENLAKSKEYFMLNQFTNKYNWLAHYERTAEEIWYDTDGKVTHFVAGMGTTGTLMGVSKKLKEYNKGIKIIGVEPVPSHEIQGLKNMDEKIVPKIYDQKRIDEKVNIEDEDAFKTARELARREGLFVGMSSGAAMYVAMQKAKEINEGVMIVLFPDGGERYLSTPLFE